MGASVLAGKGKDFGGEKGGYSQLANRRRKKGGGSKNGLGFTGFPFSSSYDEERSPFCDFLRDFEFSALRNYLSSKEFPP